jgi:hypothetical protein
MAEEMYADQMLFEAQGLPPMDEVWGWHEELRQMGTRYTGSDGHRTFIEWLKNSSVMCRAFSFTAISSTSSAGSRTSIRCRSKKMPRRSLNRSRSATITRTRAQRGQMGSAADWLTSAPTGQLCTRGHSGRRRWAELRSCECLTARSHSTWASSRPAVSRVGRPRHPH